MNVSASTVRKSSRAVSLGFTALVIAYAISASDLSGGLWASVKSCTVTMFSMLPWWATALYGCIAFVVLMSSAGSGRLKWGVAVSTRQPDRVTVWGVLLWAVVLPAEAMMLLVAWPFILGRVTLLRTKPDGR